MESGGRAGLDEPPVAAAPGRPLRLYFAGLIALFVAAAGLGLAFGLHSSNGDAEAAAARDVRFAAAQSESSIDAGLAQLTGQVGQLAATPGLRGVFTAGCSLSFAGVGPFPSGHLDVLRPDGSIACSSANPTSGRSYTGAAWLARLGPAPTLIGPVTDSLDGHLAMVQVAPIAGGGYVAGFVDLKGLASTLAQTYGGPRHFEFLLTDAGSAQVLSRSINPPVWAGKSLSGTPFAKSGTAHPARDVDGRRRIYAQAIVATTRWRVYVGVDRAGVLAAANSVFDRQAAIILGGLVLALIAAAVGSRRIAAPIRRLATSVRARSAGHGLEPIPAHGPREVAGLAADFNHLLASVDAELGRRAAAEDAARAAESNYRLLFDDNPQPMWVYDLATLDFLAVNDAAVGHYGYSREEFLSMSIRDIRPAEDLPALEESVPTRSVMDRSGPWRHLTREGNVIEVEITSHSLAFEGRSARCVMAADITERRHYEKQLRDLALTDPLTRLANRAVVIDHLDQALARARSHGGAVAVAVVDLDRFKFVNEVHGRGAGDQLLIEASDRLAALLGPADTLGRIGVNEFALMLDPPASIRDAVGLAERAKSAFDDRFILGGHDVFITASVGVAMADGYHGSDDLLRDATAAMHRAKTLGGNRYETFDSAILEDDRRRHHIETGLRRVVERGELRLHYQPEVSLTTGEWHATEALMRWQHPTLGLLAPGLFIPIAEQTGLITSLGTWALNQACKQAAAWPADGPVPRRVAVNIAAQQLAQPDFATQISRALEAARLDPSMLCLELTESALMSDVDGALQRLRRLHDTGIRISVDDFGTGYSSLKYLRLFPVDYLKVDQSFVAGLETDSVDSAIVAGVISLGHSLGVSIVAEGVETPGQMTVLQQMGCDYGQGYLWARPTPPEQLPDLLAEADRPQTTTHSGLRTER